jgi:thioesterase domain-containing protein
MSMEERLRQIESDLHAKIPLTQAMGVHLESWDEERLVLTAPLEPNHNHLGTAFGGSLTAMATLAGYAMIWLELGGGDGHVVIRDSAMRFRRPVTGEIRAVCRKPVNDVLEAFRKEFAETGKTRLRLAVTIEQDGLDAATFEGTFVALR